MATTILSRLIAFDWPAILFVSGAILFTLLLLHALRKARRVSRSRTEIKRTDGSEAVRDTTAPSEEPVAKSSSQTDNERERLTRGLANTRGAFILRLGSLFRRGDPLDASLLEEVEEILFGADIGVRSAQELIDGLRQDFFQRGSKKKDEAPDPEHILSYLKRRASEMISQGDARPLDLSHAKPLVVLIVGVNGAGKTTTIGKLAHLLRAQGKSILLAAGDTFRAAAAEQLAVWGERSQCPVVQGTAGADPSSVVVRAIKKAIAEAIDVVLVDTAGRLQTKKSLMAELGKINRSIAKQLPGAPHETFIVLDASTGQNAISQARLFSETTLVSGIVLTKMDGTAKGGVLLGICNELKIPVRFIGIGEAIDDLRPFDADTFIDALFADSAP